MTSIRRALISASDKAGLTDLAAALHEFGIEILSTGGTARLLREAGLPVREVADYTGFPEIMDGRVKTLHPRVHGALLGRCGTDDAVMREHGIEPIDLVVVNLYPFAQTAQRDDCSDEAAIEQIDIGGPAMLRSAAKNHERVAVLVDPGDYAPVIDELRAGGTLSAATRRRLAVKAFAHTAAYDAAIASYLGTGTLENVESGPLESDPLGSDSSGPLTTAPALHTPDGVTEGPDSPWPETLQLTFIRRQNLRYGENPHQAAAFYVDTDGSGTGIAGARQLQGKELSFNNIADADAALECVRQFAATACVIVKHANPCGVAIADAAQDAYERAFRTDPTSAFGGIIALNRPLDAATVAAILERQFVEVLVAPEIDEAAWPLLKAKPNVRVLVTGVLEPLAARRDLKSVSGGLLVQDHDRGAIDSAHLKLVTRRAPGPTELTDLLFAWQVCKFVKSNAIVYAKGGATLGIGAGQMSRVVSSRVAALKAHEQGLGLDAAVMASDAFLPFRDGLDVAAGHGIRAVIQPGGSVRDAEVIAAADGHGMAMVFTGMRHFRH